MSDAIGRGVIELSADSSKLNAVINEARARLKSMGDAGKDAAEKSGKSIDKYIKNLETQNALLGKSKKETDAYKFALKGATDEQLKAIAAQHRIREAYERQEKVIKNLKVGLAALAAAAVAGAVAAFAAVQSAASSVGNFQDLAEKTGDTAENLASLAVSAKVGGIEMDTLGDLIIKLNKNLSGVDDDSEEASRALRALGIDIKELKAKGGADQLEEIGKAVNRFGLSAKDSEILIRLMGRSAANAMPFLLELGKEGGRQVILTQAQIEAADEYADKQAKMRAQLELFSQAIALKMLPVIAGIVDRFVEFAKNEDAVEFATRAMNVTLKTGLVVLQGIGLIAGFAALEFSKLWHEITYVPEALSRLKKFDFKGVWNLSDEIDAAKEKDENRFKAYAQMVLNLGKSTEDLPKPAADDTPKPKLNYSPLDPAKIAAAMAARKAQIDSDLEDIRRKSDAVLNTLQNSDRILQARHAANLIDDKTYYAAKADLIRRESDEQEKALIAEISRLSKEKFIGADKIANDRKIAEARGKLAKVRENEKAGLQVASIEDFARVTKITQAYIEAAAAAKLYIDTITRRDDREAEGVGQGNDFRANAAEFASIEDRLINEKARLDSQLRTKGITPNEYADYLELAKVTYQKEVAAFEKRSDNIEEMQADAFSGMTEALHNYADESRNVFKETETIANNALSSIEDAFVDLVKTGKLSFKDLFASISADIARAGFKSLIGSAMDAIVGPAGGGKSGGMSDAIAAIFGAATGGKGGAGDAVGAAGQAALTASTTALATAESTAAAAIGVASASSATALAELTGAAAIAASALASISASSAASSGTNFLAMLEPAAGGRAIGGPVSAGNMYRVNERGPELLNVAGKQYLMTGAQSGAVTPIGQGGGGNQIHQTINFVSSGPVDRRTADQLGAAAFRGGQRAMARNN